MSNGDFQALFPMAPLYTYVDEINITYCISLYKSLVLNEGQGVGIK